MWLNQLFVEVPIDFEKRCRKRMIMGALFAILGIVTIACSFLAQERTFVLYLERGYREFISGFYLGTGIGLVAAGLTRIIRNFRYLKKPELKRARQIYENDERNRMLGLRCWAYAGYTMLFVLYFGILVGGLISKTVLITLIIIAVFYAAVLLIFRLLLQKAM